MDRTDITHHTCQNRKRTLLGLIKFIMPYLTYLPSVVIAKTANVQVQYSAHIADLVNNVKFETVHHI